jgi:hypothetical protein
MYFSPAWWAYLTLFLASQKTMQEKGYNQRQHNTQEYTRSRPRPLTMTTRNTELKVKDTHKDVEKDTDEDKDKDDKIETKTNIQTIR